MGQNQSTTSYGSAIRLGFEYLLNKYPEVFVIGQGLWSPWYVGNTMENLDKIFGIDRIIDTPVSEAACTGAAVGASLAGMKPVVVHPRMDFMLYAIDPIVNTAAKWHSMTGGQASAGVTIRAIINRGGEQGAQHSQALQSWFAHIPGLRVLIPYSVKDARDMLISAVLSNDPVMYIDDRWLYDQEEDIEPIKEIEISRITPKCISKGDDLTIVGSGYSTYLALKLKSLLREKLNIDADVIDLRVLNPFDSNEIISSVKKTGRLLVLDGGWSACGISSEVITSTLENVSPTILLSSPKRITLPSSPAPSSRKLEEIYYPKLDKIFNETVNWIKTNK